VWNCLPPEYQIIHKNCDGSGAFSPSQIFLSCHTPAVAINRNSFIITLLPQNSIYTSRCLRSEQIDTVSTVRGTFVAFSPVEIKPPQSTSLMRIAPKIMTGLAIGTLAAAGIRRYIRSSIDISGQNILITGGARGLGLVMARKLVKEDAQVIICSPNEQELIEAKKELSHIEGREVITITCDITNGNDVRHMFSQIREACGDVDAVINNAGIIEVGPYEAMTKRDFEEAMKVHFWGAFHVIEQALPAMKEKNAGRIVNIISINGKVSFPHLLPYTVSKYALSGYSEGLTTELAQYNISVTSVYPGLMRTGSPRNVDVKGKHEKEYAWFKIADSLPLLSMSAERAAGKIIRAMKARDNTLMLGLPTKLAVAMEGLFPGVNLSLFALANKWLPDYDATGHVSRKGYESKSEESESALAEPADRAAEENNENIQPS
jgi:short-subunit dehydrogenase